MSVCVGGVSFFCFVLFCCERISLTACLMSKHLHHDLKIVLYVLQNERQNVHSSCFSPASVEKSVNTTSTLQGFRRY